MSANKKDLLFRKKNIKNGDQLHAYKLTGLLKTICYIMHLFFLLYLNYILIIFKDDLDENWVRFPNAEYVKHFKKKKRDKADYPSPDECVLEMVNYQLKVFYRYKLSLCIRKSAVCIYKNKDADQLCSNCTSDQPVFVFATQIVQEIFFINPKFQASSLLL